MGLFSRLFSKSSDDFLAKGDEYFSTQRYFDARCQYEDGLQFHLSKSGGSDTDSVSALFSAKIAQSNAEMAALNISEAEYAISRGAGAKATEHLELALTLTTDAKLRQKAQQMLKSVDAQGGEVPVEAAETSAGHCQSCSSSAPSHQTQSSDEAGDLSNHDYYHLLIRQLPEEVYERYAVLDDDFAEMYLAASRDDHLHALNLLDNLKQKPDRDIFCYEKGMILHRVGRVAESEKFLRESCSSNPHNPLPKIGLVLLLIEAQRPLEAVDILDIMITDGILPEQAVLLRGDVALMLGDLPGAIDRFGSLLQTPYAKPAAEKLHEILIYTGRKEEAAAVFKKYLGGCSKH